MILSRVHSNAFKDVIEETMKSLEPNDQQKYANKLYSSSVQECESSISQQDVQSVHILSHSFTSKTQISPPNLFSDFSIQ